MKLIQFFLITPCFDSDGSRITSEESHHIFGTILHGPPDNALIDADRTEWPGFSSSTEMYYNGKNRQYDGVCFLFCHVIVTCME